MGATFVPGDWVRLPGQPDWGVGQVQSVTGAKVTVNFEHAGKRIVRTDVVALEQVESRGAMNETIHAHASSAMVRALAEIAYDAGRIVLKHYTDEIVSRRKEDHSPVTAADEEAEKFILARLAHLAPDVPVIAEEEAAAGRLAVIGHHFFLVDPLDGTKEFISRNGEFTVNIAEVIDGKPVRGVVYAPAIDRLFFGEALSGAFEIQARPGGAPDFGEAGRIAVRRAPGDGMTAVASRSHRDSKTDEYLAAYNIKDFISAGSSLKFCLVAAGEADIYPRHGRTMEWDTAAGHAVLAAAGGSVTQLDGKPFLYGKAEEKFANPFFVARGAP